MATLTLDTYEFVENLKRSGMPEGQARTLADNLRKIELEHVATKEDLMQLKVDMLKWAIPLMLGQVAVFAFVVQWLGSRV